MTLEAQVTQVVNAVVPVQSIRFGNLSDKATWSIQFTPGTSQADQDAANAALQAFNPADPATISASKDQDASAIDGNLLIRAVGEALWEEAQKCQVVAGQTLRTKPQLLARVKAIYRNLL